MWFAPQPNDQDCNQKHYHAHPPKNLRWHNQHVHVQRKYELIQTHDDIVVALVQALIGSLINYAWATNWDWWEWFTWWAPQSLQESDKNPIAVPGQQQRAKLLRSKIMNDTRCVHVCENFELKDDIYQLGYSQKYWVGRGYQGLGARYSTINSVRLLHSSTTSASTYKPDWDILTTSAYTHRKKSRHASWPVCLDAKIEQHFWMRTLSRSTRTHTTAPSTPLPLLDSEQDTGHGTTQESFYF